MIGLFGLSDCIWDYCIGAVDRMTGNVDRAKSDDGAAKGDENDDDEDSEHDSAKFGAGWDFSAIPVNVLRSGYFIAI